MYLIYIAISIILVLLNVAGITLLTKRWIGPTALARTIGLVGICLLLFFVEHFIGLGRLHWLWPLTSAGSIYLIYQEYPRIKNSGFWKAEIIFYLAFFYVFAWRFAFPDIFPSSEHVSDLYFITNYLDGTRLPPLDHWYPPHRFDVYYAFQHYAAALLGRIFGFSPGMTYNLAFSLLLALPATLAWEISGHYLRRYWLRALLVITLITGGTGMSPLLYFIQPSVSGLPTSQRVNAISKQIVASQRFIGLVEKHKLNKLGQAVFPPLTPAEKPTPNFAPRQLPLETYGYQIFLGDYHPPAGGFVLLLLALALITAIERNTIDRSGQALLTATLPLVVITNAWVLPLQALLIAIWLAYRYWSKRPPDWLALMAGGLIATALIYPFLGGFAANVQHTAIRFVSSIDHTPWREFLGLHWPLLVLIGLAAWNPTHRRWSLTLAIGFALLLCLSELFYVDDPSSGMYERTNTTMKWWGWIWTGGLVSLGTLCLASSTRSIRWITILTLLLVSSYAIDLGRFYIESDKVSLGQINGDYWLTRDPTNAAMLNYLAAAPQGIVLENQFGNAYDNTSIYALFSDKPVLLGWPEEITTWRHDAIDVYPLKNAINTFYAGTLQNSLRWLKAHQVRYIVWSAADNRLDPQGFDRIQQQIRPAYYWQAFYETGAYHVGIWVRTSSPSIQ